MLSIYKRRAELSSTIRRLFSRLSEVKQRLRVFWANCKIDLVIILRSLPLGSFDNRTLFLYLFRIFRPIIILTKNEWQR